MSDLLRVTSWPPPLVLCTLGAQPFIVPTLCPKHRPAQCVAPCEESRLRSLVVMAFGQLETTQLEMGGDWRKFIGAIKAAAPLCCVLGDAKMDELTRQVPAIWSLRN